VGLEGRPGLPSRERFNALTFDYCLDRYCHIGVPFATRLLFETGPAS
jgi:hypothetical protein